MKLMKNGIDPYFFKWKELKLLMLCYLKKLIWFFFYFLNLIVRFNGIKNN